MSDDLLQGANYMFQKLMPVAEAQLDKIESLERALARAREMIIEEVTLNKSYTYPDVEIGILMQELDEILAAPKEDVKNGK